MRHRRVAAAAVAVAAITGVGVTIGTYHSTPGVVVATIPGATNPNVTQANINATICVAGYTATIRPPTSYTGPIKTRLVKQDGYTGELDHLVPLELGGSPDSLNNLWIEPAPRFHVVDQLENSLHRQVCSGALTLDAARKQIVTIKQTKG